MGTPWNSLMETGVLLVISPLLGGKEQLLVTKGWITTQNKVKFVEESARFFLCSIQGRLFQSLFQSSLGYARLLSKAMTPKAKSVRVPSAEGSEGWESWANSRKLRLSQKHSLPVAMFKHIFGSLNPTAWDLTGSPNFETCVTCL